MHLYAAWITLVQFTFLVSLAVLAGRSQVARLSVKSFNQLWLAFAIIGLLSLVCYTPLFSSFESTIHVRGRTPVELLFPFTVFLAFVGTDAGSATVIALAFLIPGVIAFSQRHRLEMVYFTALLLVPLLAMWLVIRPFDLYARFFVYWLPYFTLLLATGICSAGTWLSNFHKGVAPKVACWAMAGALAWTWVGQGWRIMPQAPFRQAVTWLSQGAGESSTLCGFGPDVVMLNYYASAKIHVMTSTLQLNQVIDTADDLRCAFHDVRWASDLSRAMAATMAETLSSRRFRRIVVYGPGRLDAPRATE
jgi:hypothetical protein